MTQDEEAIIQRGGRVISAASLSKPEVIALAKIVAAAQVEIDRLVEKFGEEPDKDGAVIRFTKHFGGRRWDVTPIPEHVREEFSAKTYHYAAIRIAGRWWTTGVKHAGGYAWEELLAWLEQGGDGSEKLEILDQGYSVTKGELVNGPQTERHPGYQPQTDDAPLTGKVVE